MKNKIKALSLIFLMIFLITACSGQGQNNSDSLEKQNKTDVKTAETVDIKLSTPFAPNSIPLFYMMEKELLGENINLDVSIHKTRQEVTAMLMKKNIDMAMLSVQEAAKLYNKDIPVKIINANYGATFFLMSNKSEIQSIDDINGKTIWTSKKGGPVEFVLSSILSNKGIKPNEDIKLKYMNLKELSQLVINDLKDIEFFTLREPFVSQVKHKKDNTIIVSNLDEEWKKIYGNRVPFAGVVSRSEFISNHPQLVSVFNEKYSDAIKWVKENPKEAAKLGAKYLKGMPVEVIEEALNNMELELIDSTKTKSELKSYYNQWLKFNPSMIGNKIPDDDFYSGLQNE
ncbi:ABC transporter substrate-binding protein [Caldisalinibacter kiritimatiensis]|uniref:Lipoprotein, putative n=1 Tax=Caldisalinibacter kiritimatiensis TaxID=1304284 RepID=R1CMH2_9FIRM|nr:ABC transporter substrate-binding protein [Caldisalinibacter kiritimatiensis]EOC99900.1 lipoprotein, putative [Caldisalinibacter kiritimatiensis]